MLPICLTVLKSTTATVGEFTAKAKRTLPISYSIPMIFSITCERKCFSIKKQVTQADSIQGLKACINENNAAPTLHSAVNVSRQQKVRITGFWVIEKNKYVLQVTAKRQCLYKQTKLEMVSVCPLSAQQIDCITFVHQGEQGPESRLTYSHKKGNIFHPSIPDHPLGGCGGSWSWFLDKRWGTPWTGSHSVTGSTQIDNQPLKLKLRGPSEMITQTALSISMMRV